MEQQLKIHSELSPEKRPVPHYNILLVEDHAPNVVVTGVFLEAEGYSYLVAEAGEEAIKLFQEKTFDLILMDLNMPGLNGMESTQAIRDIEKAKGLSHTPVIAMTAHIANRDMQDCVAAGIDDIVPKPFHPDYFKRTLEKYCKKS